MRVWTPQLNRLEGAVDSAHAYSNSPCRCAGAWGEQHYGSGLCEPLPLLNPRPGYSAYATMTRQLNRMNFVKVVKTPSNTVFCVEFKHYKTGKLLHVFWTIRGQRPVTPR